MQTDDELLRLALGDDAGWEELHQLCLDRGIAEKLAQALERRCSDKSYPATVWAGVLREMHPGLAVRLRDRPGA